MLGISPKVYFFNPLLYQLSYRAQALYSNRSFMRSCACDSKIVGLSADADAEMARVWLQGQVNGHVCCV